MPVSHFRKPELRSISLHSIDDGPTDRSASCRAFVNPSPNRNLLPLNVVLALVTASVPAKRGLSANFCTYRPVNLL